MRFFTKNSVPLWSCVAYFALLVVVGGYAHEKYVWAKIGILVLIAPFPIFGISLVVLAYGEWLFNMTCLYHENFEKFVDRILAGFAKICIVIVVLAAFPTLAWVSEPPNQWIFWEAAKIGLYFAIFSIVSLIAYVCYKRIKDRKLYQLANKMLQDATQRQKAP